MKHTFTLTVQDLPMYPKPDDWQSFIDDLECQIGRVVDYYYRNAIVLSVNATTRRNVPEPHDIKLLVSEALSDVLGDLRGAAMDQMAEAMESEHV